MIQYRVSNALRATFEVSGSLADLEAIILQLWTDGRSMAALPGATHQWSDGREEREILVYEVLPLGVLPRGNVGEANTSSVNRGVAQFRVDCLMEQLRVEAECVLVHGKRLADTLGAISFDHAGLWETLQWSVTDLLPSNDYEVDLVSRFEDHLELRRVEPLPDDYVWRRGEAAAVPKKKRRKLLRVIDRQEQVSRLYHDGYTDEQIAEALSCGVSTVKKDRKDLRLTRRSS